MTDRTLREKIEALTEFAFDGYPGVYLSKSAVTAILDAHTAAQPAPVLTSGQMRHAVSNGTLTAAQQAAWDARHAPVVPHETPVHVTQTGLSDTGERQKPAPDAMADVIDALGNIAAMGYSEDPAVQANIARMAVEMARSARSAYFKGPSA